jgi:hypothetical protein
MTRLQRAAAGLPTKAQVKADKLAARRRAT